jgi:hypothetical protein
MLMDKSKHKRIDRILDAELAWHDFLADVVDHPHSSHSKESQRYIRVNPKLEFVPKLDDKAELGQLQRDTIEALKSGKVKSKLQAIAFRLVASTFYYERLSAPKADVTGVHSCSGNVTMKL